MSLIYPKYAAWMQNGVICHVSVEMSEIEQY